MRRSPWILAAVLLLAGCGEPRQRPQPVPPMPRAVVHVQPARLGVGQVGVAELSVVTPPGHRLLPVEIPGEVPGLWLLDARTLPTQQYALRWIHRTRIRFRPRESGSLSWPAQHIVVQGPEDRRLELETDPVPLSVGSALERLPDRTAPFPLRSASPARGWGWRGLAGAFLGGAFSVGAGIALAGWRRRRERARHDDAHEAARPRTTLPWTRALDELEPARSASTREPRASATRASATLRRYLHHRFGIEAEARTTPELAATKPPLFLASRWAGLLATLQALDDARFRPSATSPTGASSGARVRAAVASAESFVRDTIPPEERT